MQPTIIDNSFFINIVIHKSKYLYYFLYFYHHELHAPPLRLLSRRYIIKENIDITVESIVLIIMLHRCIKCHRLSSPIQKNTCIHSTTHPMNFMRNIVWTQRWHSCTHKYLHASLFFFKPEASKITLIKRHFRQVFRCRFAATGVLIGSDAAAGGSSAMIGLWAGDAWPPGQALRERCPKCLKY